MAHVQHVARALMHDLWTRQVNQNDDANIGSATQNQDPVSASQLLATLAPVALIAAAWLALFFFARPRFGWNYSPRASSHLLKTHEHTTPLSKGMFGWFKEFWNVPDTYVLQHSSLDAFFFLRLLKLSVVVCLVGAAISWPILFAVDASGNGGKKQLDKITFANIGEGQALRYLAHVFIAYLYFGFIMVLILRESVFYVNLRQAYLMNPAYARKLPSRTVLYTAVPDDYLDETKLRDMLGNHVTRFWFPTNTKELDDLVKDRTKAAMKLEAAETKAIRTANAARLKGAKSEKKEGDVENYPAGEGSISQYLDAKKRPSHKSPMLFGKKHDTIQWARSEIERLTPIIDEEQHRHRANEVKRVNAVFVEFDSLSEAQSAYQSLTHHQMLKMSPRFTGMHPQEIIWSNLRIKGWERFIRVVLTISIVTATIVFWSIPVAFIGVLSNIRSLVGPDGYLPWLNFLLKIPSPIFGVVQGLLPAVLLALLMSLLPPYLRFLAKQGGAPTTADIEYIVSNYYFAFQVIQVFLVTTITSAASAAVTDIIKNPSIAPSLLSSSLPQANNFYLSYIILQGLGVFSGTLAAVSGLVIRPLMARFLGSTPRKLFTQWNKLKKMSYGTVFPVYTNLLVIAIAYSSIAPLVTGLSAIGLFLFYFAYRYNILYVYDTGPDTKGLLYPRALQQLFVGLYLAEICLIGLIAVSLGKDPKRAIASLVLSIILLVITGLFHVSLNSAISPLLQYLPKTLDAEERKAALITRSNEADGTNGIKRDGEDAAPVTSVVLAPKHPKPNMFTKFLKPHIYCDYATMRRLMPTEVNPDDEIDPVLYRDAYENPSVWNEVPRLIIPRDPVGMSGQEVVESGKVVAITDAGAVLNEKNKMILDEEKMSELYFAEKPQRMGYDI